MPNVLVTIPFSHFCEKARWALDLTRTPYVERRLVPPLHLLGTIPRGGRTTPLLVTEDGKRLTDSTDILRWLDDRSPGALYPRDRDERREVEAIEDQLDEVVGPAVRRLVYHAFFQSDVDVLTPIFRASSRGWQRSAAPVLSRVAKPVIRKAMKVNAAGAARSQAALEPALDALDRRLEGREYLVGEAFTAADLTLAALLAPFVRPEEHPVSGGLQLGVAALDADRDRYRARPSGKHAMRVYAAHR
ncbi:MAG: glutathione S-transferase family protein [Sandaracinus sp.]|nr:glutathione S-transferase family protein [Sandaracinus sp.]MCB9618134.1 glutathione S-transferase family protein [Sandaracinus sp.]MCB9624135.1 glutathione S-transferase family protein [Sandaracinus sp.]MCB9636020.1 glutathione S-transferase family protein [Sandaracinus sp.]